MNKKIKLIVGIGNYESRYFFTRHNAGIWYAKLLAKEFFLSFREKKNFLVTFLKLI